MHEERIAPGGAVRPGEALGRGEGRAADGIGGAAGRGGEQTSQRLACVVGPQPRPVDEYRLRAVPGERAYLIHARRRLCEAGDEREQRNCDHRRGPTSRNSARSEAAQRLHSVCASTLQK